MRPLKFDVSLGIRAAAIACCVSFVASAANSAPPPAKPAAVAPPVVNDDPGKVAAARDFLLAYRPKLDPANASAMIDKMMPNLVGRAKANDPKLDTAKFEKEQRQHMMDATLKSLDMQSHVVSRHFTIQELKGLQAFYSGPLGKRLIEETPNIVRDMMREKGAAAAMPIQIKPDEGKAAPVPPKKK